MWHESVRSRRCHEAALRPKQRREMHAGVFINKHMNCRYEPAHQQVGGVTEPNTRTCVVWGGGARRTDHLQPSAYQNLTIRIPQDMRVRHNVLITQTGPVHSVLIEVPYESGCFGLKQPTLRPSWSTVSSNNPSNTLDRPVFWPTERRGEVDSVFVTSTPAAHTQSQLMLNFWCKDSDLIITASMWFTLCSVGLFGAK